MDTDPITRAIAEWGAVTGTWGTITGTLAVGWTIFRHYRDRGGRLRVDIMIGGIVDPNPGGRPPYRALIYTLTNTGNVPVRVTTVGGTLRHAGKDGKKHFFMYVIDLPRTLQPGDQHTELSEAAWAEAADAASFYATDTLNRTFKAPRKQVEKVRIEAAKDPKRPME